MGKVTAAPRLTLSVGLACVVCLVGLVWIEHAVGQVDFHSDVMPLLTRSGCNSGACHGAASGRGNMALSLLGSRPSEDYWQLVRAFESRRVNLVHADQSLILRKPSGQLDHGGDTVLPPGSPGYGLLRQWISEGAPKGDSIELLDLKVEASSLSVRRVGQTIDLTVWARFEPTNQQSNPQRNVTWLTQFAVEDNEALELQQNVTDPSSGPWTTQLVRINRPGQHVIFARYLNRVVPILVRLPYPMEEAIERPQPNAAGVIDQQVLQTLEQMHRLPAQAIDDYAFLRRVSLDLTGRLPDLSDIESFGADTRPDKRGRLIDRLLASVAFVDYWSLRYSRWLNLHGLPNETQGVQAYGQWIRQSIVDGTSWALMAEQLLSATGDAFEVGPANFARMVSDARAHAEQVSRIFMGARMGCANCHDHPLDKWTQDDYHGLAAIFARLERGQFVRELPHGQVTNPRTGQPATPRLPGERDLTSDEPAMLTLARWLRDSPARLLARAYVNRHWHAMMGQGLVEAVDDLRQTNLPSHPQLFDWLVQSTLDHDYDMRHLLRMIASSDCYARESAQRADAMLIHAHVKSLAPEVWLDAIADVTGIDGQLPLAQTGVRAVHIIDPTVAAPALDVLGRCRRTAECDTGDFNKAGLATQLHLINGQLINDALGHPQGRLQQMLGQGVSTSEIVRRFVTLAWSRPPTAAQLDLWVSQISADGQRPPDGEEVQTLEDFLWALLASQRFQRNH